MPLVSFSAVERSDYYTQCEIPEKLLQKVSGYTILSECQPYVSLAFFVAVVFPLIVFNIARLLIFYDVCKQREDHRIFVHSRTISENVTTPN